VPVDDDADGELTLAALQAKKDRLQADHDRLTSQLKRHKDRYEIEHQMRLDSEKVAEDCVRRSKITDNQLNAHKKAISDLNYDVRAHRNLAIQERLNASLMKSGSMGYASETLLPLAAGQSTVEERSLPPSMGVASADLKGAKSPAASATESHAKKKEPKSQRVDGGQDASNLGTAQNLENLLHEVSATAVGANDGADIEILRVPAVTGPSTPVLRLKHPSGNEVVVHLRTGLFWRWATSDGRVLLGGLPQIWPDVIPYEGQVWSLEADALKDDQDEPSVTLTHANSDRQCRVQMSLSACARGLRQRITVENLGTNNLVFQVAARASEATAIEPPPDMFPAGDGIFDARCLDPMPSSPVLVAPSGSWAAMRRWTDRQG